MKTCCPACQTVFRVTSEQLKARAGKVRCGQCRKVFNALEGLLDDSEPVVVAPAVTAADAPAEEAPIAAAPPAVAVLLRKEEVATPAEGVPAAATPADPAAANSVRAANPADGAAANAPLASVADLLTASPSDAPSDEAFAAQPDSSGEPAPPAEAEPLPAAVEQATGGEPGGGPESMLVARETRELPGHSRWLEGVMSKPVSATAGRRPTRLFLIAIGVLALLLVGQLLFHFRGTIVLIAPSTRPALAMLSAAFGTAIPLPRHADLVSIEASDLQTEPGRNKLLSLQATLRNRASYAQAFPAIELTLTDTDDKAVARRVFMPEEYLPASVLEEKAFRANGDVEVRLSLDAKEVNAVGYRLYVFYP